MRSLMFGIIGFIVMFFIAFMMNLKNIYFNLNDLNSRIIAIEQQLCLVNDVPMD